MSISLGSGGYLGVSEKSLGSGRLRPYFGGTECLFLVSKVVIVLSITPKFLVLKFLSVRLNFSRCFSCCEHGCRPDRLLPDDVFSTTVMKPGGELALPCSPQALNLSMRFLDGYMVPLTVEAAFLPNADIC